MAGHAFSHNLTLFSQDLKYFTFEAIDQPRISDFRRLNRDRRHVDQIVTYLDSCVKPDMKISSRYPDVGRQAEESQMRIAQLQMQASKIRQEFNDTFQLLISVLSVLDSEISKTQAQRSTALTVLAAIYLPFSLATGVYGMNIAEISNHPPKWWAVIALGMALLTVNLLVVYFILSTKVGNERRSTDHVGTWDADHLERGSLGDGQSDVPPSRGFKILK